MIISYHTILCYVISYCNISVVPCRVASRRPAGRQIRNGQRKGEVLLRGMGTLRYSSPPNASVQWQPGDSTTTPTSGP